MDSVIHRNPTKSRKSKLASPSTLTLMRWPHASLALTFIFTFTFTIHSHSADTEMRIIFIRTLY